jgi:outer membrane protein assembly factor BamE (lipoprotein component of BamABCDE complex)
MTNRNIGLLALLLVASLSLGGCVVMANSHKTYECKGRFVGQKTLDQVEPGETTKEWVLAVFGEPTETKVASDDTDILHYRYVERKHDSLAVLVLIAADNNTRDQRDLYFEIKDGVVRKFWQTSTSSSGGA